MQLVLQTAPEAWYVVGDSIKLRVVWKNQTHFPHFSAAFRVNFK